MVRKTKQQGKNDANTGKVPQEVAKDKSSLKSVAHDDHLNRWHQCPQNLPVCTIIDIRYLKQLAIHAEVPVAYCKNPDIDKVENFVPAYLYRFTRHMWQLLDEEDFILSQHYWEEGDDSILNLFGTYMQHPEEKFVKYFGLTPVAAFDERSMHCSQRKNPEAFEEGSMHCSPRKNSEAFKEGSTRRSPMKNPEQGSPIHSPMKYPGVIRDQPEKSSQLNCTSAPPGEEDVIACCVSPRHIVLTDDNPQKLAEEINVVAAAPSAATATVTAAAANTVTMETTVTATMAAVTMAASNNNANPRLNVQSHPRKTNPRQLPLNKHRPSSVYYHSAFTTYPRHNRLENVASTLDVLDTLLKAFSSRARVDSKKNGILPLHHGPHPRTSYPRLT